MNSKILITVEGGKIKSVIANGNAELFVNNLDDLAGTQKVVANEVTNERFEQVLAGLQTSPTTAAQHSAFPEGRWTVKNPA